MFVNDFIKALRIDKFWQYWFLLELLIWVDKKNKSKKWRKDPKKDLRKAESEK